ncbi:unnamed protein product [Prunus armeniaca]
MKSFNEVQTMRNNHLDSYNSHTKSCDPSIMDIGKISGISAKYREYRTYRGYIVDTVEDMALPPSIGVDS